MHRTNEDADAGIVFYGAGLPSEDIGEDDCRTKVHLLQPGQTLTDKDKGIVEALVASLRAKDTTQSD